MAIRIPHRALRCTTHIAVIQATAASWSKTPQDNLRSMTFNVGVLEIAGLPATDSASMTPIRYKKRTWTNYTAVSPKFQILHHRRTARNMARDLWEPATILSTPAFTRGREDRRKAGMHEISR